MNGSQSLSTGHASLVVVTVIAAGPADTNAMRPEKSPPGGSRYAVKCPTLEIPPKLHKTKEKFFPAMLQFVLRISLHWKYRQTSTPSVEGAAFALELWGEHFLRRRGEKTRQNLPETATLLTRNHILNQ